MVVLADLGSAEAVIWCNCKVTEGVTTWANLLDWKIECAQCGDGIKDASVGFLCMSAKKRADRFSCRLGEGVRVSDPSTGMYPLSPFLCYFAR